MPDHGRSGFARRLEMNARPTILAILACSTAWLPTGCSTATPATPNIVVIYTDDQGYGDCSAYNPEAGFRTPNMDRIMREGMRFTDGHSAGSVCTPSRYAVMTGRYAWRLPGGGGVVGADHDGLIENGQLTLASLLRDRGYATAFMGKWHLGLQIPGTKGSRDWSLPVTDGPLQKGFDEFYGIPASMNYGVLTWFDGDRAIDPASMWTRKKFPPTEITTPPLDYRMAPPYDTEPSSKHDIEVAPGFVDEEALAIITARSVDYIHAHGSEPFFLYVSFTSPHLPHCTAPEFRGTSGMGNYGDFLVETDHRIGQILDALDRAGVARDTLVLFSSDNGPENNHKDWSRLYGHASAGGFRGGKRDVHEGGHRVPFAVRWPRSVEAGSTCSAPVGQVDFLATIADLLDHPLDAADRIDGHTFLPELEGTLRPRPPLIHHGRGRFALRDGRWKLIFTPNGRGLGEPDELYDLEEDPAERRNLVDSRPDVVARLQALATSRITEPTTTESPPRHD